MKSLAILALAASLQAATPKPPTIPDALAARFWKAQVEMQRAQQQMQQAQSAYSAVIKDLQTACGDNFVPSMSQTGDPVCSDKPKAKK